MSDKTIIATFYLCNLLKDVFTNDLSNLKKNALSTYCNDKSCTETNTNAKNLFGKIKELLNNSTKETYERNIIGISYYFHDEKACDVIIGLYSALYKL